MIARRLEHYERLLQEERKRVVSVLERFAVSANGTGAATTPGDDADAGALGANSDDDVAILARESAALQEIDDALRRLRESPHDFGICVQCGRPIPDERLEMMPATRFCGRRASLG